LIAPAQGADSDKLVGAVDDGLGYRSGLPCEDALGLAEVTAYFLPRLGTKDRVRRSNCPTSRITWTNDGPPPASAHVAIGERTAPSQSRLRTLVRTA
jgi:hypothetical protein